MIFPNKYLKLNNSLINLGAIVIKEMKKNVWYFVDEIWRNVQKKSNTKYFTFDDLIIVLDFLFCVNCISMNSEGKVCLN